MDTLTAERDVLGEVRQLKARLKRTVWISVEDKVPNWIDAWEEAFNYVLVYDERYGVNMARFERGAWIMRLECALNNVTHWMPLPEPPKEEQ